MENRSELVSRRVRTKIVTEIEIDRYFDGDQCLGDNLTKAAITFYGMSRNQIARLMGVDRKTVAEWYGGVIPNAKNAKKLFKVIKAWRKMKLDLEATFSHPLPAPLPSAQKTVNKKVDNALDEEPSRMDTKVKPESQGDTAEANPLDPAS